MTFTPRIIAALVAIGLIVLLIAVGPSACTSFFTVKQEARTAKGQAEASIESGAEAMNTVSNVSTSDAETDATVKEGIDEIRNASEADRGLATQRAACRLRINRNDQRCAALRGADPGDAAPGR